MATPLAMSVRGVKSVRTFPSPPPNVGSRVPPFLPWNVAWVGCAARKRIVVLATARKATQRLMDASGVGRSETLSTLRRIVIGGQAGIAHRQMSMPL
jgi:hypothetical protein